MHQIAGCHPRRRYWPRSRGNDAAEADVRGRAVLRLRRPRRGPVAVAVLRRAQMRAALERLVDAGIRVPASALQQPVGVGVRPPVRRRRAAYGVVVHSHTLPIMSTRPNPFGGNAPTGDVPTQPSAPVVAIREAALPGVGHQRAARARPRHPTRRSSTRHRARRTPTRPRSAAAAPPTRRRPRRRRRQTCTTGWSGRSVDPRCPVRTGVARRARRPVPPLPPVPQVDRPRGRPEHQRAGRQVGRRPHPGTARGRADVRRR